MSHGARGQKKPSRAACAGRETRAKSEFLEKRLDFLEQNLTTAQIRDAHLYRKTTAGHDLVVVIVPFSGPASCRGPSDWESRACEWERRRRDSGHRVQGAMQVWENGGQVGDF